MNQDAKPTRAAIIDAIRRAARQEQFLEVVSAAEARRRFEARLDRAPLAGESLPLAAALSRVVAADVIAPIDAPPFDRANVDGFALRAADTLGAGPGTPKRLTLNREVIACGVAPVLEVASGTATAIATGGVIPRGADVVVMIEHTELIENGAAPAIDVRRAVTSGQFVSFAGSDIARGETLLRRGIQIGSREIGMLAACGLTSVEVVRRPRVAVLSTGDELVQPGEPLRPGGVFPITARQSGLPGLSATPCTRMPGLPSRVTTWCDKSPAPFDVPPLSTTMSHEASAARMARSSADGSSAMAPNGTASPPASATAAAMMAPLLS